MNFDAHHLPTRAASLALLLAPAFGLAAALVSPAITTNEARQLDIIAQHPARWYSSTLLLLASSILLIPALLGITRLARERAPRLGTLGGGLAVFGALIAIGDATTQLVSWQMAATGASRTQMAALLSRLDNTTGVIVVFACGGLAALAGVLVLSVSLVRGRAAPTWAAAALAAGVTANFVGFTSASEPIIAISWGLLLVAMGYLGWTTLAATPTAAAVSKRTRPQIA
jgi:hypothetical protein